MSQDGNQARKIGTEGWKHCKYCYLHVKAVFGRGYNFEAVFRSWIMKLYFYATTTIYTVFYSPFSLILHTRMYSYNSFSCASYSSHFVHNEQNQGRGSNIPLLLDKGGLWFCNYSIEKEIQCLTLKAPFALTIQGPECASTDLLSTRLLSPSSFLGWFPLYFGCRDGVPIHIVLLLMQ